MRKQSVLTDEGRIESVMTEVVDGDLHLIDSNGNDAGLISIEPATFDRIVGWGKLDGHAFELRTEAGLIGYAPSFVG